MRNCRYCFRANIEGLVSQSTKAHHQQLKLYDMDPQPLFPLSPPHSQRSPSHSSMDLDPSSDDDHDDDDDRNDREPLPSLDEYGGGTPEPFDPGDYPEDSDEEDYGPEGDGSEDESDGEADGSEMDMLCRAMKELGLSHESEVQAHICTSSSLSPGLFLTTLLTYILQPRFPSLPPTTPPPRYHLHARRRNFRARLGRLPLSLPRPRVPSEYVAMNRLKQLSDSVVTTIDCCPNSHMAYTGGFADYTSCAFCPAPWYQPDGTTPTATYQYISLKSTLWALQANKEEAERMQYRVEREGVGEHEHEDIFDGSLYRSLRPRKVKVGGSYGSTATMDIKYFSNKIDVTLVKYLDGFAPFKKKHDTCWSVKAVNLNLPPSERYKQRNLVPLLTMPGPRKPRHMDLFMELFYAETIELGEQGHWVQNSLTGTTDIQ